MNNTKNAAKVAASPEAKHDVFINEMEISYLIKEMDKNLLALETIALEPDVVKRSELLDEYYLSNQFDPLIFLDPNGPSAFVILKKAYSKSKGILLTTMGNFMSVIFDNKTVYEKEVSSALAHAIDVGACWMSIRDPRTPEDYRAHLKKILYVQD